MAARLIPSPVGPLYAEVTGSALTRLQFKDDDTPVPSDDDPLLDLTQAELKSYFAGILHRFTVPVHFEGNEFECRVWSLLREIPYGAMWTYGEMAQRLGDPGAARAVGRANNQNPVAIIVPCHRVVGAGGALIGFGGGLDRKRALLNLEAAGLGRDPAPPALKEGERQGSFF